PAQSEPAAGRKEAAASCAQGPNSMAKGSRNIPGSFQRARNLSNQTPLGDQPGSEPAKSCRRTKRKRAAAEQGLHQQRGGPESRKLPTTAFIAEHPSFRAVHHEDRANYEWNKGERHKARSYSEDEQRAAAQLRGDGQIADEARQPQRTKIRGSPRRFKHQQFERSMGEKKRAKG